MVSFTDTAANTGGLATVVISGSNVQPASVTFNNSALNYTVSGSYGIVGSTGLTKSGTGLLTIATGNGYTGPTTISGGTLAIGGAGNLGGGNYAANIANSGALVVNTTSNQTFGGIISGNGALYQSGSAITTLLGANTYTGGSYVNGGTLQLQGNAFNTTAGSYAIASGAVLNLSGAGGTLIPPSGITTISGSGALLVSNGAFNDTAGGGRNTVLALSPSSVIIVAAGAGLQYRQLPVHDMDEQQVRDGAKRDTRPLEREPGVRRRADGQRHDHLEFCGQRAHVDGRRGERFRHVQRCIQQRDQFGAAIINQVGHGRRDLDRRRQLLGRHHD